MPRAGSLHKLPNITAHRQNLSLVHAANDRAGGRCNHPGCRCHAEPGRLLDYKTSFGKLQGSQKKVLHAAVSQFHYEIRQGIAMWLGICRFLDGAEYVESLRAEALGVVETKERLR